MKYLIFAILISLMTVFACSENTVEPVSTETNVLVKVADPQYVVHLMGGPTQYHLVIQIAEECFVKEVTTEEANYLMSKGMPLR